MHERETILIRFTPKQRQLIEKYSEETRTQVEKMRGSDFIAALGPAEAEALGFIREVKSCKQHEEGLEATIQNAIENPFVQSSVQVTAPSSIANRQEAKIR